MGCTMGNKLDPYAEQIIEWYTEDDETLTEIGERMGCHRNTVRDLLERNGIEIRRQMAFGDSMLDPYETQVTEWYRDGLTIYDIAERLKDVCDPHPTTVANYLKGRVEMRPGGFETELPVQKMVEWYESGISAPKIAEMVGVTDRAVRKHLHAEGVEMRNGSMLDSQADQIKEWYLKDHLSLTEIADRTEAARCTVYDWLKSNGVEMRPRGTHLGGYYDCADGRRIPYHSSWERRRYRQLDTDEGVCWWQGQPKIAIPYTFKGSEHVYHPDLLIIKGDQVIIEEIKADWLMDRPQTQAKLKAGRKYCTKRGFEFVVRTGNKAKDVQ